MSFAIAPAARVLLRAPPAAALVFGLILLAHGGYALLAGPIFSPDSHTYDYWSGRLIAGGFDYLPLIAAAHSDYPAALYTMFVTLVAALKAVFGPDWASALVAINIASAATLAVLVVRLSVRLTDSALAGWGALLLCLACFDLAYQGRFVLSDPTFVLLGFVVFQLAIRPVVEGRQAWLPAIALCIVTVFYRPTGIVLVAGLAWCFLLARTEGTGRSRLTLLAALAAGAVACIFLFAWFLQDPGRWPVDVFIESVRATARDYLAGEVVKGRTETYHPRPVVLTDYAAITFDRFLHFFAVGVPSHHPNIVLMRSVFFVPVYLLIAILAFHLLSGKSRLPRQSRDALLGALGMLLAFALFHALLQIDNGWRYRLPTIPFMVLLASGGIGLLDRKILAR